MKSRVLKSLSWVFALACIALLPMALVAQDTAKPAAKAYAMDSPSKWDFMVGYSYLAPHGTVVNPGTGLGAQYDAINYGAIISAARFFDNYVGIQIEGDAHTESQDPTRYARHQH